jgi:hypothetical protein
VVNRAQPDRRHAAGPVGQIGHDRTGGSLVVLGLVIARAVNILK